MKNIRTIIPTSICRLIAKTGFYCLLILPAFAYSQEGVLAVMSSNGKIYQDFFTKLENNLDKNISVLKISQSEINNTSLNNHKIIITIGFKAAKAVSKYNTNSKIIYALIPDDELLQRDLHCDKYTCSKIFINQPVERYIKLFKALFPSNKRLVMATTNAESKISQKMEMLAKSNDVAYKIIYIQKGSNIPRTFIKELKNGDVLLALPNPNIYNVNNAKTIILSTYHANVPIIAYSKSFTKAGALIGLYSSIDNIAEKTANIIKAINSNTSLKQNEYYPDDFMIEVNSSVARSLNINIESESLIKRKIR